MKRKVLVKLGAVCLLAGVMLTFSSCSQTNKVSRQNIITAIGVDSDSSGFIVTTQEFDTSSDKPDFAVHSIHAQSVFSGLEKLSDSTGKQNYYSQLIVFVVGKSALEHNNLSTVLDVFNRNNLIQPTTPIIATEGKASELLSANFAMVYPAVGLSYFANYYDTSQELVTSNFLNIYARLSDPMCDVFIPVVNLYDQGKSLTDNEDNQPSIENSSSISSSGDIAMQTAAEPATAEPATAVPAAKKEISIEGAFYFNQDKLQGKISKSDIEGLVWLLDSTSKKSIIINDPKYGYMTFQSKGTNSKITSKVVNSKIIFSVNISAKMNLVSLSEAAEVPMSQSHINLLQDEIQQVIDMQVSTVVNEVYFKNCCDIFNFGRTVRYEQPLLVANTADDAWRSEIPNTDVRVTSKVSITKNAPEFTQTASN